MILDRFIKSKFSSYEDFSENYKVKVPENLISDLILLMRLHRKNLPKSVWSGATIKASIEHLHSKI
jgi:hypothetical protein